MSPYKMIAIYVLYLVQLGLSILAGALFLRDAILAFRRSQYFLFALNAMVTMHFAVNLIQATLRGI